MQVSVEIEVRREGAHAAMSLGTWFTGTVWADAAGAAKVGGLVGACVRLGSRVAGVELLGAARLRERLGEVRGRLVRLYREDVRRPDIVDRVAAELHRADGDNPAAAFRSRVRRVAEHLAPWAEVYYGVGNTLTIRVPRWLPQASVVELRRRIAVNLAGAPVVVTR